MLVLSELLTPRVITAPTLEPVTLADFKVHQRIDGVTEDANITGYLIAARLYLEKRLSLAIMEQTLEISLDAFPGVNHINLPRAKPLTSITSLKYKDSNGADNTWAASNYIADTDSIPGRLVLTYGNSWPSFTAYPVSPIRVRYVTGKTVATAVDWRLRVVIMRVAGNFHEYREADAFSDRATMIAEKHGVEATLASLQEEWVF